MKKLFLLPFLLLSLASYGQPKNWVITTESDTIFLISPSDDTLKRYKPLIFPGATMKWLTEKAADSISKNIDKQHTKIITGNVVNSANNTLADITNLSFDVSADTLYSFKFFIVYNSAATTTGSRWTINGPANTFLHYTSQYTLTATSFTFNTCSAYNFPSAANASSLTSNNIAIIEGIIKPSASGTVIARFASEVNSSAITVQADKSFVQFKVIN